MLIGLIPNPTDPVSGTSWRSLVFRGVIFRQPGKNRCYNPCRHAMEADCSILPSRWKPSKSANMASPSWKNPPWLLREGLWSTCAGRRRFRPLEGPSCFASPMTHNGLSLGDFWLAEQARILEENIIYMESPSLPTTGRRYPISAWEIGIANLATWIRGKFHLPNPAVADLILQLYGIQFCLVWALEVAADLHGGTDYK
jgi:hypothetical protein